jgi:predicted GNAT family N-acyltransferase
MGAIGSVAGRAIPTDSAPGYWKTALVAKKRIAQSRGVTSDIASIGVDYKAIRRKGHVQNILRMALQRAEARYFREMIEAGYHSSDG